MASTQRPASARHRRLEVPAKPGEIWEEAKGLISAPSTVPRTLNDRAQGLDVEDLSIAQVLALMEARRIETAQLAAVGSE